MTTDSTKRTNLAGALQHLLLLLTRALEHVGLRLLRDAARFSDQLLRLVACALDVRLVLLQEPGGFVAILLGGLDRGGQRLLARFDGAEDDREDLLVQDQEEGAEDDQRPEHQVEPDVHEARLSGTGFGGEEQKIHHCDCE